MRTESIKEIKTIKGNIIPKGTEFKVFPLAEGNAYCVSKEGGFFARVSKLHELFNGFEPCPSMDEINSKLLECGLCKTPTGKEVSPEERDNEGFCAWINYISMKAESNYGRITSKVA